MADQTPQNLQNHTRYDPAFHFVLAPLFLANLIFRIYELVRHFMSSDAGDTTTHLVVAVVVAFGLLLLTFKVRLYALKDQDRVIRLEERLRLQGVLAEPLRSRIPELTEGQLVALRFAPDGELTELVKSAVDKKLSSKDIKQGICNWRPDYWRI
jgi:hypothetical protein